MLFSSMYIIDRVNSWKMFWVAGWSDIWSAIDKDL